MTQSAPPRISIAELKQPDAPSPLRPNFLGYTVESWQAQISQKGPVLIAELDGKDHLVLCNHETDRRAWKAPEDWLYGSPTSNGDFFLREMGQNHISQQDGAAHRRSRKLLLPGFGINAVSRDIGQITNTLSDDLNALCAKPIDLHAELCVAYTRALGESQVKAKLSADQLRLLNHFEEWFINGLQLPTEQQLAWHTQPHYLHLKTNAFQIFDAIAAARLSATAKHSVTDTLQELLDREASADLEPLKSHELRNLIYLLLVAGVGNIANLACCMAWTLDGQPDWRFRLIEELSEVPSSELAEQLKGGMKRFPLLQATVFETERCFLPAPVVPKTTTRDLDVLGYHVPANMPVQQMIGMSHFDESRYADAMTFKPERWLDPATSRANAYGGGIHLCLGMGVSRVLLPLTLALLMKNHKFSSVEEPKSLPIRPDISYSPLATRMNAVLERL